jgi:hypothetical protein
MLRQLFASEIAVLKTKPSDESVTSSTTLQNDDDLFFAIRARETWHARLAIWVTHIEGAGSKLAITMPSGASMLLIGRESDYAGLEPITGGQAIAMTTTSGAAISLVPDAPEATFQFVELELVVVNGATDGTVQLQWAQASSSETPTVFLAHSSLVARRK